MFLLFRPVHLPTVHIFECSILILENFIAQNLVQYTYEKNFQKLTKLMIKSCRQEDLHSNKQQFKAFNFLKPLYPRLEHYLRISKVKLGWFKDV